MRPIAAPSSSGLGSRGRSAGGPDDGTPRGRSVGSPHGPRKVGKAALWQESTLRAGETRKQGWEENAVLGGSGGAGGAFMLPFGLNNTRSQPGAEEVRLSAIPVQEERSRITGRLRARLWEQSRPTRQRNSAPSHVTGGNSPPLPSTTSGRRPTRHCSTLNQTARGTFFPRS